MQGQAELSDIQRFYEDSTVFLTGATGFIGKLILEKILRALPVKKVYIHVRARRDQSIQDRVETILDSPIFDQIKRDNPNVLQKIFVMEGDCSVPLLGLSNSDIATFKQEVNVVMHCAATTRFDEHIRRSTMINIRGTKDLLELFKQTKQMKVFIYIGTAYSNCNRSDIKESIYPAAITAEKLISACDSLDDDSLTALTPTLLKDWPNTYTFTKQVTEEYLDREGKHIPVCICRPAIVISTSAEPVRGFVDNIFTLAGFILTHTLGYAKVVYYKNTILNIIPADYVVNECIAAGWQTGKDFMDNKPDVPIYNMSTCLENALTQDQIYGIVDYHLRRLPSPKLMTSYPIYFRTACRYNYLFLRFFLHTLLAWFMDLPSRFAGRPPKCMIGVNKLHKFQDAYRHFTTKLFIIHVDNTRKLFENMSFMDRSLFNFDTSTLNWDSYFSQYIQGLQRYLLNEEIITKEAGMKHYKSLKKSAILGGITAVVLFYALVKILLFRVLPAALSLPASLMKDH